MFRNSVDGGHNVEHAFLLKASNNGFARHNSSPCVFDPYEHCGRLAQSRSVLIRPCHEQQRQWREGMLCRMLVYSHSEPETEVQMSPGAALRLMH